MNWHARYLQQAKWTRDLRAYLFNKAGITSAHRILEVGCGTGAILNEPITPAALHGLDVDPAALTECRLHAPTASLTCGNALALPYSNRSFDIVYCHYLLLWVGNPLQALNEMKRVARSGGHIIAFAEPDYAHRIDSPEELAELGKWQTESLIRQGANPSLGAQLAELFFQAGIKIVETGAIESGENKASMEQQTMEWDVVESDLAGSVSKNEIQKLKLVDQQAWKDGKRVLQIPTYFVWGQV